MSSLRPDRFGAFASDPAAQHYISQINNRIESTWDGVIDGVDIVEQFANELIADDLIETSAVRAA